MKGTPEQPQCGFSRGVLQMLTTAGISPQNITAINVLEDAEMRAGIKEFTQWPTLPQLFVRGEFIGGFDIVSSLHRSGELAALFDDSHAAAIEDEDQKAD